MLGLGKNNSVGRDWFGLNAFQPGPRFSRDGARLYLLSEVASTNDFLAGRGAVASGRLCHWAQWGWQARRRSQLSPVSDPQPGTVVVARRQTAGRGRQGRSWLDCGGLQMSVVVPRHRASFSHGFSVWLGLLTALCLREDYNVDARLKWPNDIIVRRRKLGGLLLESKGTAENAVIIAGLGLNLDTKAAGFPAELQGVATSVLLETGKTICPGELAGRLLQRIEAELDRFEQDGWQPYRHTLSCLDSLLGHQVQITGGGMRCSGRSVGIDDRGRLVLENIAGERFNFSAGDVHLLSDDPTQKEQETS